MAKRQLVLSPDELLRKKSREVTTFDARLHQLLDDMAETMKTADGVGLAAPQIGVLRRAVIVDVGDGVIELINPKIIQHSGEQRDAEGCLSCPGEYGIVERPMHVVVEAQDRHGKKFTIEGEELKARAFCHEIDHLDGIIFKKRAIRMLKPEELEG